MSWTDKLNEIKTAVREMTKAAPETAKGFGALSSAAKHGQALDDITLELVALAISVADRCEPCILFHTDALAKLGATRDQVVETLEMCIQMGGGPSLMYASKALSCFDEFTA